MGGIIAAEMAAVARHELTKLVLLCPADVWDPDSPSPDLFSMLPFEMTEVLFHDPVIGEKLMMGGIDFGYNEAVSQFMVGNARRPGTAGKILFPIQNRRLSKRIHRTGVPKMLLRARATD